MLGWKPRLTHTRQNQTHTRSGWCTRSIYHKQDRTLPSRPLLLRVLTEAWPSTKSRSGTRTSGKCLGKSGTSTSGKCLGKSGAKSSGKSGWQDWKTKREEMKTKALLENLLGKQLQEMKDVVATLGEEVRGLKLREEVRGLREAFARELKPQSSA